MKYLKSINSFKIYETMSIDNIFKYEYLGIVTDNKMDDSGKPYYCYEFVTGKYIYNVIFFDEGDGVYEREFYTIQGRLGKTEENMALKIYGTVTAITLDFMEKRQAENNFDYLSIQPLDEKRLKLVMAFSKKFFTNYDVEYVSRKGIIVKPKNSR